MMFIKNIVGFMRIELHTEAIIKKTATHRVAFFSASGPKCARSCASLIGFSRKVAPSTDGSGGNSNDPESMITGTPCSCSRAIRP
jgi:hypothetical protein